MTLVRASDGATMWSQTFNTAFANVFDVEDEIATCVVSKLRVGLSQAERMRLTKHHTSKPGSLRALPEGCGDVRIDRFRLTERDRQPRCRLDTRKMG